MLRVTIRLRLCLLGIGRRSVSGGAIAGAPLRRAVGNLLRFRDAVSLQGAVSEVR